MDQNIRFLEHAYNRLHDRTSLKMGDVLRMIRSGIYFMYQPDKQKKGVMHYALYSPKDDHLFSLIVDDNTNQAVSVLDENMIHNEIRYHLEKFLRLKYQFIHHKFFVALRKLEKIPFEHKAKDILIYSAINRIVSDISLTADNESLELFKSFLSNHSPFDKYIEMALNIKTGFINTEKLPELSDELLSGFPNDTKTSRILSKTDYENTDYRTLIIYYFIYKKTEYKKNINKFIKLDEFHSKNDEKIASFLNNENLNLSEYWGFLLDNKSLLLDKPIKVNNDNNKKDKNAKKVNIKIEDKFYKEIEDTIEININKTPFKPNKADFSQDMTDDLINLICESLQINSGDLRTVKLSYLDDTINFKYDTDTECMILISEPEKILFECFLRENLIKSGTVEFNPLNSLFYKKSLSMSVEEKHDFVLSTLEKIDIKPDEINHLNLSFKNIHLNFQPKEELGMFDLYKKSQTKTNKT